MGNPSSRRSLPPRWVKNPEKPRVRQGRQIWKGSPCLGSCPWPYQDNHGLVGVVSVVHRGRQGGQPIHGHHRFGHRRQRVPRCAHHRPVALSWAHRAHHGPITASVGRRAGNDDRCGRRPRRQAHLRPGRPDRRLRMGRRHVRGHERLARRLSLSADDTQERRRTDRPGARGHPARPARCARRRRQARGDDVLVRGDRLRSPTFRALRRDRMDRLRCPRQRLRQIEDPRREQHGTSSTSKPTHRNSS